ncbi:unnamed protein product [Allacma fusca]|uniref:Tetratricopeptide repeat protein n=1 Tax=Allacma fusca TaxID=39272 RepID=A0A8J2PB88_9HEXA|nr:unnamed protein product [Allacma fusca]
MIECNSLKELEEYPQLFRIEDDRKFKLALHLKNLDGEEIPEDLEKAKMELKLTLYNNVAGCHVLRKNWEFAVDLCNSVLEKDPNNIKALYRRGWSRMEIEDYEMSRMDLENALKMDPKNQAVIQKLFELSVREKSLNSKYASAMKKMFS